MGLGGGNAICIDCQEIYGWSWCTIGNGSSVNCDGCPKCGSKNTNSTAYVQRDCQKVLADAFENTANKIITTHSYSEIERIVDSNRAVVVIISAHEIGNAFLKLLNGSPIFDQIVITNNYELKSGLNILEPLAFGIYKDGNLETLIRESASLQILFEKARDILGVDADTTANLDAAETSA